jgi:uncharacterized membrane protein YphA (DoxX/SURF4 family)
LRIGTLAVVALVALRLAVGWHFFREGADKIIEGNWTSIGFMKGAVGPLAPMYRAFAWDGDGRYRLDKDGTLEAWDQYRQRAISRFRLDDAQAQRANKLFQTKKEQLEMFFDEYAEDIYAYLQGLERRDRNRKDPVRREVASLRGQAETIERDLSKQLGPWLTTLDDLWASYEQDMNALGQEAGGGHLALPLPGRHLLDTKFIDGIIPTFDLLVGAFLICGLFTRITSLAAAIFLASIIGTQWPGAPGAMPTHYQVVEMFALLVLAALGAGRFAGLDFLLGLAWRRCCPPKPEKKA